MTRRKVPVQFITSDSSRKVTFKKRKKGLIKKVSELSTLCGIEACAIIYGPFSNEPEVWPSPAEARHTIARFRNMSDMDRGRGMVNQPGFLRQRMGKAETQLKKQQRDNRDKEVTHAMFQILTAHPTVLIGLNPSDLKALNSSVGKTLHEVEERIRLVKNNPPHLANGGFLPQQGFVRVPEGIQMEGQGDGFNFEMMEQQQQQQQPQWFMDLLRPTELFGNAGPDGGLGFADNNNNQEEEEEANITNGMMMMMMNPSSSSSMPIQQMQNTDPNAAFSSSWPNFLYP